MKRKVLASLLVIAVVAGLVGAGTWAFFSDTGESTGNTFTAGTLILELANEGGSWGEGVTATWQSPPGWAPGDELTNRIWLRNVGSVDGQVAYGDWANPDCGGGANLLDVTEVTEMTDSLDSFSANYVDLFVGVYDQNADGKLSLYELIVGDSFWPGSTSPWEEAFFTEGGDPWSEGGEPLLPAGGAPFGIGMTFKFMEDAGDEYQGASCTFDLILKVTQKGYPTQEP